MNPLFIRVGILYFWLTNGVLDKTHYSFLLEIILDANMLKLCLSHDLYH
jgi:hypothetical protein